MGGLLSRGAARQGAPKGGKPPPLTPYSNTNPPATVPFKKLNVQSTREIDPALLKAMYEWGPALKKEAPESLFQRSPEVMAERARRKKRFQKILQSRDPSKPAPAGQLSETHLVSALRWREEGDTAPVDSLARGLRMEDQDRAREIARLVMDFAATPSVYQVKHAGDQERKLGVWAHAKPVQPPPVADADATDTKAALGTFAAVTSS